METKQETITVTTTLPRLHKVEAPIFIIFAEYLGYVSRFLDIAEKWCDGKIPNPYIQKVLMIEAKCIQHQAEIDFGQQQLIEFYERYYPIILQDYVEDLQKVTIKPSMTPTKRSLEGA